MGPTPPGTGVNTEATVAQAGSASPTIAPPDSAVPASMSVTPGDRCSGRMSPGLPAPETIMSAPSSEDRSPASRVMLVTCAPCAESQVATGSPTSHPFPTTTAVLPAGITFERSSTSLTAATTGGRSAPSSPASNRACASCESTSASHASGIAFRMRS